MAADPDLAIAVDPTRASHELTGKRLGVLTFLGAADRTDPEVAVAFERALVDSRACGAELVPIDRLLGDGDLEHIPVDRERFPADLDAFLATRMPPHDALRAAELMQSTSRPTRSSRGDARRRSDVDRLDPSGLTRARRLSERLANLLTSLELSALIHPTWSRAPQPLDAGRTPNGDNSGFVAPPTGCPAITVPMGFTSAGLPLGIEFVAWRGGEAELIRLASAYERATLHRRASWRSGS